MELHMDLALARRIERAEAVLSTSLVEARSRLMPGAGGTSAEMGGAILLFDGPGSPMTQSFGLGLDEPLTAELLSKVEAFFFDRGVDAMHELSPLAGVGAMAALVERGYRPIELTSVLVQSLDEVPLDPDLRGLVVRPAGPADVEVWIETSLAGWSAMPELREHIRGLALVGFESSATTPFLVEGEGKPVATGVLGIGGDVALLVGASTVPEARARGAQRALLAARLAEAKRRGCTLALMGAPPGSTSQRNAGRNGFRIAYTRTKWHRVRPGAAA